MSEGAKQPSARRYIAIVPAVLLIVVASAIGPFGLSKAVALVISGLLFFSVWRTYQQIGLPEWTKRCRPWLRFYLLTLLAAGTLFGLVWAWVAWSLDQVEQRSAFIVEIDKRFDGPGAPWQDGQPIRNPSWNNILLLIWLWGHHRGANFNLNLPMGDPRDKDERIKNWEYIQRAQRLFPEATISLKWREAISENPRLD